MDNVQVQEVLANPKFKKLVEKRNKFGWFLTAIILIAYYGYVGIIAFDKKLFAVSINGGTMTWGIPVAFGLMLLIIALTGFYILVANSKFDDMKNDLLKDLNHGDK